MLLRTQIIEILKHIIVQSTGKPVFSVASIEELDLDKDGKVTISFNFPPIDESEVIEVQSAIEERLKEEGASEVNLTINVRKPRNIHHVIAVSSGKGGVGKSTVSTNIAIALSQLGKRVGLLDADIYGPDIPMMFGVNERPYVNEENKIIPIEKYGVKLMSIGFLLDKSDTPVAWRGPLVTKAIEQFYNDVEWGELDYLIIDLPPGTGDVQLTIAQSLPTKYGIVVTTPQDVSILDASKALNMFRASEIEVMGIIENMSYFVCPETGTRYEIFGSGGGERLAKESGARLIGRIPLEPRIRKGGDEGNPVVLMEEDTETRRIFLEIAKEVTKFIEGS